jgi:lysophospholipase L1-like esterase
MRRTLIFSLLLNSLLAGAIGYMVIRLGGLKYVFYRLNQSEAGLYTHRASLFKKLPAAKNAIVFLGDSQIEQCEWRELTGITDVPVLNRGITGDQVEGVRARLPEIKRHQPSKIFLCVGINNLLLDQNYSEIDLKYRDLVRELRSDNRSLQLYIISVLPVNNQLKSIGIDNTEIIEVNNRLQQIARNFAVPYIDLAAQLTDASGNLAQRYTSDGIHLNAEGYMVWKKLIDPFLTKQ